MTMKPVEVRPVSEQIAELEATIQRNKDAMADRAERIRLGYTDMDDCFVSQRIEEKSIEMAQMQIELLKSGGTHEFITYFDENGNELTHSFIADKYRYGGSVLVIKFPDGRKPVFQSLGVKDLEKCLAKKGIRKGKSSRPAWVKFFAGGTGMYGAYMARPGYYEAAFNRVTGERNPRVLYED